MFQKLQTVQLNHSPQSEPKAHTLNELSKGPCEKPEFEIRVHIRARVLCGTD